MLKSAELVLTPSDLIRRESGAPSTGALQRSAGHELPADIEPVARSLARTFEDATGDGGALLKSFRRITATAVGRVLLRQSIVQIAVMVEATTVEPQPHSDAVQWIKEATRLPMNRIAELLGVSRPTVYAWLNNGEITDVNRRRLLTIWEVLERAQRLHRSPAELTAWLESPRTEEGHTPFYLLANGDFNRARLLALSTPSSRVKAPPSWTTQAPLLRQRVRPEYVGEALPPDDDDELAKLLNDEPDE